MGKVAAPKSATLSKSKLYYKYFSIDLSTIQDQLLIKEKFEENCTNFGTHCVLCYSRYITPHFQLLQLVLLTFTKQGQIA